MRQVKFDPQFKMNFAVFLPGAAAAKAFFFNESDACLYAEYLSKKIGQDVEVGRIENSLEKRTVFNCGRRV